MSSPLHRSRLLLCCVLLVCGSVGFAAEQQANGRAPLVVSSLEGNVHATSANHEVPLKVGSSIALPVSLRVGSDGALELHQGQTVISAAANSRIDIPKSTEASETLERVMQTQGNVYYSVAKRPAHKLNIETPFLVAVIKGTRFNVSATDTTATVSLLEGSIEIQGGTGDKVNLEAGQMASGSRGTTVRVMQMTTGDILHRPTASGKQSVVARSNPWDQHATIASTGTALPASVSAASAASVVVPVAHSSSLDSSASGSATVRGNDHGASSALALNQLISSGVHQ
jgi:hypothetical protein